MIRIWVDFDKNGILVYRHLERCKKGLFLTLFRFISHFLDCTNKQLYNNVLTPMERPKAK